MEGGSRAGEVRKVHVVYFLSRNGEMEQPHLVRVRHRSHRDGIRLRDVKRWLSELRGKGMPDAFAWSYKRRYKTGYVWQDLADDDLITPISDNEYVLKGSLTTATTVATSAFNRSLSSAAAVSSTTRCVANRDAVDSARTDWTHGNQPGDPKPPETASGEDPDRHDEVSPKPPPLMDEEEEEETVDERHELSAPPPKQSGPLFPRSMTGGSTVGNLFMDASGLPVSTGGSFEIEEEAQSEGGAWGSEEKKRIPTNDSFYSLLPGRRRAHSWCGGSGGRASHAFRNLLGCGVGAVAVDNSVLMPAEPHRRGQLSGGKNDTSVSCGRHGDDVADVASSGQSRGEVKSPLRSKGGEAASEMKTAAAPSDSFKPMAEPICSQCGKPFKPEKLHSHMKSCRALRSHRRKMSSERFSRAQEAESSTTMGLPEEASSLFLLSH